MGTKQEVWPGKEPMSNSMPLVRKSTQNAVVATEDRSFYKNSGINYGRFFLAIYWPWVAQVVVSTITQQLAILQIIRIVIRFPIQKFYPWYPKSNVFTNTNVNKYGALYVIHKYLDIELEISLLVQSLFSLVVKQLPAYTIAQISSTWSFACQVIANDQR